MTWRWPYRSKHVVGINLWKTNKAFHSIPVPVQPSLHKFSIAQRGWTNSRYTLISGWTKLHSFPYSFLHFCVKFHNSASRDFWITSMKMAVYKKWCQYGIYSVQWLSFWLQKVFQWLTWKLLTGGWLYRHQCCSVWAWMCPQCNLIHAWVAGCLEPDLELHQLMLALYWWKDQGA